MTAILISLWRRTAMWVAIALLVLTIASPFSGAFFVAYSGINALLATMCSMLATVLFGSLLLLHVLACIGDSILDDAPRA